MSPRMRLAAAIPPQVKAEVSALEEFVHGTLWAGDTGDRRRFLQAKDHSVRLSMLYWSDAIDKSPEAQNVSARLYRVCHKCWRVLTHLLLATPSSPSVARAYQASRRRAKARPAPTTALRRFRAP